MLRSLKDLDHYTIVALDAELGGVVDFLFDLDRWVIRYFVVATGRALCGREVPISPVAFCEADWESLRFFLTVTLDSIKRGPLIDPMGPISNEDEQAYVSKRPLQPTEPTALHSARKLQGYRVEGSDGTLGHIEDFIVDDETWEVRYWVLNTNFGNSVLIAPKWARNIDWDKDKVDVRITRQSIEGSPVWHRAAPIAREYESRLFEHYGRPGYWDHDERPTIPSPSCRPEFHSVKPVQRSRLFI